MLIMQSLFALPFYTIFVITVYVAFYIMIAMLSTFVLVFYMYIMRAMLPTYLLYHDHHAINACISIVVTLDET